MDSSAVILLVTWIITGQLDQPKVVNSYQVSFSSAEACETARNSILQDAQRINAKSRAKWTPLFGAQYAVLFDASVSAVCTRSETGSAPQTFTGTSAQALAYDAYRWARVAAELGDPGAQAQVGVDLLISEELRWMADSDEGMKWLNRSAQHGCFDAFFYLSIIYASGVDYPERPKGHVSQDYVEALKWLDIATSRKDVKPCNWLFDFYHGGPRNPADANRDPLKEQYDQIISKMTPDQIAEAEKLAREWKPTDLSDRQAWDRNGVANGTREHP